MITCDCLLEIGTQKVDLMNYFFPRAHLETGIIDFGEGYEDDNKGFSSGLSISKEVEFSSGYPLTPSIDIIVVNPDDYSDWQIDGKLTKTTESGTGFAIRCDDNRYSYREKDCSWGHCMWGTKYANTWPCRDLKIRWTIDGNRR